MHATIIARRRVLRVRPDQAHRAGALGLPADGRGHSSRQDLVQTALARLYVAWPKVRRAGTESAYVWRIVVNAHIDEVRRPGRRRERHVPELPEPPASPQAIPDGLNGGEVRAALAALPPGMRAAVVLRHWRRPPHADWASQPVNGRPGQFDVQGDTQILTVQIAGGQWVVIQAPVSLGWDGAELANFASGVQVLGAAQQGRG